MKWSFERRKNCEWRDKQVRVLVSCEIEQIWTSDDGKYSIFHYPPRKCYCAQYNGVAYCELGARFRSLTIAKKACERHFGQTDWEALGQEEEQLREAVRRLGWHG